MMRGVPPLTEEMRMVLKVVYKPSGFTDEEQFIGEITSLMSDFGYIKPGILRLDDEDTFELTYEKELDDSTEECTEGS